MSSVITIHNDEYKPKSGGICVANHTSTFDVAILSTQTTFCLVIQNFGKLKLKSRKEACKLFVQNGIRIFFAEINHNSLSIISSR